jgi:tetratricopeptide (TPR) repeat protein
MVLVMWNVRNVSNESPLMSNSLKWMAALIAVLCLTGVSPSAAAPDENEKYRIAMAYERSGDLRNAARLFQELHASEPRNDRYFDGVVRSLSGLGQYASLIPLAEKQAGLTDSPNVALLVGTLYAKSGTMERARNWWEKARSLSGDDESILVQIGRDQMEVFLHADALETFLAARSKNGSSTAYADEVFKLRSASGDVAGAVADVIAAFATDGNSVTTERRLSSLMSAENGIDIIAETLSSLPRTSVRNLRLLSWFYRETKRWKDALEVVAETDKKSSVPGSELLMFADGARASEQYEIALKAYDEVARRSNEAHMVMSAAFGSVRCLELQLRGSTTTTAAEAREIIQRYDQIIARYGSNPVVADALYFSSLLYDDILGEIDPARDRLMRIVNTWKSSQRAVDASIRLADIYLVMNQDQRAIEILGSVVSGPSGLVGEKADLARVRLADIFLWNGQLDSARSRYQALSELPGSIAANDAIDRLLLINLAMDDSTSVVEIAKAEGLMMRRRYSEAVRLLDTAIRSIRDADLRDRSHMLQARACLAIGDSTTATESLRAILDGNPDSIYGDRAMWQYADIMASKYETTRAIQTLEALLRNYPRSIIVPEARERIRRLRGDR